MSGESPSASNGVGSTSNDHGSTKDVNETGEASGGGNVASMLQQAQQFQGRRVPLGVMSRRRSSFGMMEAGLGDLFGRRASGFSDFDVLGRRGSLDSTSAVLDAAIMDITRRRLSMAMGTMPGDNFMPETFPSMGSMGNIYGSSGADGLNSSLATGGIGSLGGGGSESAAAAAPSSQNEAASSHEESSGSSGAHPNPALNSRQMQLKEQQRDLERRQKELEVQRQKLVSAMEERRRIMQQMQQKLGQVPSTTAAMQRNSLLGSFGGGLGNSFTGGFGGGLASGLGGGLGGNFNNGFGHGLGGNLTASSLANGLGSSAMGSGLGAGVAGASLGGANANLLMGLGGRRLSTAGIGPNSLTSSSLAEEVAQQEALAMALQNSRRASLGLGINPRRSSLDLLIGTLDRQEYAARLAMQPNNKADLTSHVDVRGGPLAERRFSLSGDMQNFATPIQNSTTATTNSNGPFAMMNPPLPLGMDSDMDWLTPLHCFVRRHCVQVFTATEQDIATPSKGKRKPIQVGQVGIRCPHCHHEESSKARERGSVYYPTSINSIYNATMNLLQRHLHNCNAVPADVMRRYETLKADDARSGTSKKYWVESAISLGLVDTPNGIRFSALSPPPLPGISRQQLSTGNLSDARRSSDEFFSTNSNIDVSEIISTDENDMQAIVEDNRASAKKEHSSAGKIEDTSISAQPRNSVSKDPPKTSDQPISSSAPLVTPADESYATAFSYHLLLQMQPCVFTEADRLGKRKGLPPGFPGLACRHCFGGYGSGRFFPSSIKTLSDTSKTLNVLHNHMMRCRKCPPEVREQLAGLRKYHDEQRAKMKFGSQKAFFARIWDRLHFKDPNVTSKRKFKGTQESQSVPSLQAGHRGSGMDPSMPSMQPTQFDAALAMQYAGIMNKKPRLS